MRIGGNSPKLTHTVLLLLVDSLFPPCTINNEVFQNGTNKHWRNGDRAMTYDCYPLVLSLKL